MKASLLKDVFHSVATVHFKMSHVYIHKLPQDIWEIKANWPFAGYLGKSSCMQLSVSCNSKQHHKIYSSSSGADIQAGEKSHLTQAHLY